MSKPPYQQAEFQKSVVKLQDLPLDNGIEVAFVGRSNAGKSTAINALCTQKNLARTSKTPGRTQAINVFALDDDRRIMDLPGYGYAKAAKEVQHTWSDLIDGYLQQRQSLRGLVLLMDVRHPLQEIDYQVMGWCAEVNLPVLVLLSKADKLKYGALKNTLLSVRKSIHHDNVRVVAFSALKSQGLDETYAILDEWYGIERT